MIGGINRITQLVRLVVAQIQALVIHDLSEEEKISLADCNSVNYGVTIQLKHYIKLL